MPMDKLAKRLPITVLGLLLVGAAARSVPADTTGDSDSSWTTVRPRLFFTPERVEGLRRRSDAGGFLQEAWNELRSDADRLLRAELVSKEYADGGSGQHGNYGRPSSQVAGMASTLGLAYRMTGEERYAEKLKDALLHYGKLDRWAGDAGHDPPWHSELNTARFCFAYAVGYDSLHDTLSDSDRRTIRESMIRLGIRPTLDDWILSETRIHALDSMGHNWWSVCVSMAGLAALSVLGDEPAAEDWVRRVSESFPEFFYYGGNVLQNKSVNFDRMGAFYESVNYANYALSEYLLFRLAYSNTFPGSTPPAIPILDSVGDYFVDTCYPTGSGVLSVNFGDSSLRATGSRTVRLLRANGFDQEAYRWYLSRTELVPQDPVALVYDDGHLAGARPPADHTSTWYPDIGWVVLRSSWEDDATLLALKSGFTWNHAHPDAGSFVLFHGGKPLIIDSGNCSYGRREYTSYYRHSRAHNVILVDDEAQNPEACARGDRGVKTPGSVHRLLDAAGLQYVFADATGPTAWKFSRNYRHVLWLDRDVVLVVDDVRTHEPSRLEWLLHYEGQSEARDGSLLLANGDTCRAVVQPLFPPNLEVVEKKGLKDHDPDTEVPYVALTPKEPLGEAKFLTAILPFGPGGEASLPVVERLEEEDAIGARIRRGELVTDVYLNFRADGRKMHRNSCNTVAGWETDAYLFAVTRPADADPGDLDAVERYFVACGSYLRREGTVVLGSLSKVYTVFSRRGNAMEVALSGQPVMNVSLRAPEEPTVVVLNGQATQPTYDAKRAMVRLSVRPK